MKATLKYSTKRKRKSCDWGTVAEIDVLGSPQVLLLDYDTPSSLPSLKTFLSTLRVIGIKARWFAYRRTRKGWHVEIGIKASLTPPETVAAQAVLGSDIRREAMNLCRVISLRVHKHSPFWRKRWNILFLKKL